MLVCRWGILESSCHDPVSGGFLSFYVHHMTMDFKIGSRYLVSGVHIFVLRGRYRDIGTCCVRSDCFLNSTRATTSTHQRFSSHQNHYLRLGPRYRDYSLFRRLLSNSVATHEAEKLELSPRVTRPKSQSFRKPAKTCSMTKRQS